MPEFDTTQVRTIITQATPHQSAVMNIDQYMSEYYGKTNAYWTSHVNTTLKDVIIVSTAGGYRDLLVRAGHTHLHGVSFKQFLFFMRVILMVMTPSIYFMTFWST